MLNCRVVIRCDGVYERDISIRDCFHQEEDRARLAALRSHARRCARHLRGSGAFLNIKEPAPATRGLVMLCDTSST